MTLDALYMPLPAGSVGRREEPMGPWPEPVIPSPAQIAANRARRLNQVGQPKAPNRVKR